MAKAKPSICKSKITNIDNNKKKKQQFDFSESEIDVAEQLIQLSGDFDNNNSSSSNHEEVSDGGTSHLIMNISSNHKIKENFFDKEDDGFDPRRKKRFKSLSEIYSVTDKLLSVVDDR